jgi:hypothetical protein
MNRRRRRRALGWLGVHFPMATTAVFLPKALRFMFQDSKIFSDSKHVSFYVLSSAITYFGKLRVGTWNPLIQISKTMN